MEAPLANLALSDSGGSEESKKYYENVWSRLIAAMGAGGKETLKQLQHSSVLVIGLKGLGIEIGK